MSSLHLRLRSLKQWSSLVAVWVVMSAPFGRLQAQSWYNSAWANRKPITINHAKVSGSSNLTNFPVLVSLPSDSNLAAPGAQASGNDILFTVSDGTTKLNHEIESFFSSTGQLTAWVQIPTLSPTADTTIYMYYGNSSAANQQSASAVWDSNFQAVYHMSDNAASTTVLNSTSYPYNGTAAANTNAKTTTGKISQGLTFNGSSDRIHIPTIAAATGTYTIEFWESNSTNAGFAFDSLNGGPRIFIYGGASGGQISYYEFNTGFHYIGSGISTAALTHVALTFDPSAGLVTVYVNGVSVGTGSYASDTTSVRSADWIKTEYNNQSSPSAFYSVGGQQPQGGGGGTITITMASSPPGLSLTVDGGSCTQPSCTYQWNPGSSHTIAAPSPQTLNGTQYTYASWSDGQGQTHTVTPTAAMNYTATFNAVSAGPNLITNYSYDLWDNLSGVTMVRAAGTQTRTFAYNGKYLTSATNPENGTVNYTYTASGQIASKTDAKGQQIVYTYDASLRLSQIQRFPTAGNEDASQRTTFIYDSYDQSFSQYTFGRRAAAQYAMGPYQVTEEYSYTQAGQVTGKRLVLTAGTSAGPRTVSMDTFQTYDNVGRPVSVKYPAEVYTNSSGQVVATTIPTYTTAYDSMGRPITLTDGQQTPVSWVNNVQ